MLATFDKFDQTVIYMFTEHCTTFARSSFVAKKATTERLGPAAKA